MALFYTGVRSPEWFNGISSGSLETGSSLSIQLDYPIPVVVCAVAVGMAYLTFLT